MASLFSRLFKGREPSPARGGAPIPSIGPLLFKDGEAALTYCCQYMNNPLAEGHTLLAVVLDAAQIMGATQPSVTVHASGYQSAMLRVASSDGGFMVVAATAGPIGPQLHPGQLVVWQAGSYSAEIAKVGEDQRFGWVGLIVGTLKPEWRDGNWIGFQRFQR